MDTLPGDVFLARGYAPPMISASGRSRVKSLGAKIPLECLCNAAIQRINQDGLLTVMKS